MPVTHSDSERWWYRMGDRVYTDGATVEWDTTVKCTCPLGKAHFRRYGMSFCKHAEEVVWEGWDVIGPSSEALRTIIVPLSRTSSLAAIMPTAPQVPFFVRVELYHVTDDEFQVVVPEGQYTPIDSNSTIPDRVGFVSAGCNRRELRTLIWPTLILSAFNSACSSCDEPIQVDGDLTDKSVQFVLVMRGFSGQCESCAEQDDLVPDADPGTDSFSRYFRSKLALTTPPLPPRRRRTTSKGGGT